MHDNVICVIPARLASSRIPRKMLLPIHGKPLLQWTWEAAMQTKLFDSVLIALDDPIIAQAAAQFHADYLTTPTTCLSGTERLIHIAQQYTACQNRPTIWVNWQGDEPCITKAMIMELLHTTDDNSSDLWTLKTSIHNMGEVHNPNNVKVVCDAHNNALYFSRSPIPYIRDCHEVHPHRQTYFKHIGIYAYRTETLLRIGQMEPCMLETHEKLEQLRFLYYGLKIKAHNTDHDSIGVDTLHDLTRVEKILPSTNR